MHRLVDLLRTTEAKQHFQACLIRKSLRLDFVWVIVWLLMHKNQLIESWEDMRPRRASYRIVITDSFRVQIQNLNMNMTLTFVLLCRTFIIICDLPAGKTTDPFASTHRAAQAEISELAVIYSSTTPSTELRLTLCGFWNKWRWIQTVQPEFN